MPNYIYGTNGSDILDILDGITDGADVIYGYNGNDFIWAGGGADTVYGGSGDDYINGGAGNDLLIGGTGADQFNGGTGTDTVSYDDSSEGVQIYLTTGEGYGGTAEGDTYASIENATGSSYADLLVGNDGNNVLAGLGGNDTLKGGGGADTLYGDSGSDTLKGGGGADTLNGGSGVDTASYADSSAAVFVSLITDTASGGDAEGDELNSIENLTGSSHADTLWGNDGVNVLRGNDGNDTLKGFGGADTIYGGDGNDTITGGVGLDTMYGGANADTFVWSNLNETGLIATADIMADFNAAQGDRINVHAIDANELLGGNQDFVFIGDAEFTAPGQIAFGVIGGNTYIGFNTDDNVNSIEGSIMISGVVTPEASWFVV